MKKFTRRSKNWVSKITSSLTTNSKSSKKCLQIQTGEISSKNTSSNMTENLSSQSNSKSCGLNSSLELNPKLSAKLQQKSTEKSLKIPPEKAREKTLQIEKSSQKPSEESSESSYSSYDYELPSDFDDSGIAKSPQSLPENELHIEEVCKFSNPVLALLKPKILVDQSTSWQFSQGPVQPLNSINVSERQVDSFFEIFNDQYVKMFLKCDSCYLLSDKYLNAAVISLLVRSKIDPDHYRSVYFIVLYMVNEMLEESHHRCHLLSWIRDDPLLPDFVLKNLDKENNDEIYKRLMEVRFCFIKDLLKYRVISSLTTLLAYMRVMPSHYVWQRERCDSHKGRQLTVEQLRTTHKEEARWILIYGGNNYKRYNCKIKNCKTADPNFTKGFKPFLASGINGKRKLEKDNSKDSDKLQTISLDNTSPDDNYQEKEQEEQNEVTKSKNARLELSCMLKIQESQAKVMQWLAIQEDKSLDYSDYNSVSQV